VSSLPGRSVPYCAPHSPISRPGTALEEQIARLSLPGNRPVAPLSHKRGPPARAREGVLHRWASSRLRRLRDALQPGPLAVARAARRAQPAGARSFPMQSAARTAMQVFVSGLGSWELCTVPVDAGRRTGGVTKAERNAVPRRENAAPGCSVCKVPLPGVRLPTATIPVGPYHEIAAPDPERVRRASVQAPRCRGSGPCRPVPPRSLPPGQHARVALW
jgi:hypothetical protein